jgi:hypothetical protein
MDEASLKQAYLWFKENGYEAVMDIGNLCLYVSVWNDQLEECIDVLLSTSEVEFRADLYQSSLKN